MSTWDRGRRGKARAGNAAVRALRQPDPLADSSAFAPPPAFYAQRRGSWVARVGVAPDQAGVEAVGETVWLVGVV